MSSQRPAASRGASASRPMAMQPAGTFFVSTLIGAVAVALFTGDPQMMWGYIGAFTITVALGIGIALRADQHNRSLAAHREHEPPR